MNKLRDKSGDKIELQENLLKKFKLGIFGILKYKPGKNDAELIKYLNEYRKYSEYVVVNNIDYKNKKSA